MTTILTLAEPVSLDRIHAWARAEGLACSSDGPLTNARRTASFASERAALTWMCRAGSATALLLVQGEGAAELETSARSVFTLVNLDALLDRLAAARSPADRVRAASDLGVFCELAPGDERARVIEALGAVLLDDHRAVRWTASDLLSNVVDRRAEALLAAAAERHADLAPVRDRVRWACDAEDDGTLLDGPTDNPWELRRRAREGVAKGQWKRVAKAAHALLAADADDVEGLYYRGLVHEAEGDLPLALAHLGAARATRARALSAHDKVKQESEGDDASEDDKAEERALLATLVARIEELRAAEISAERWTASREPLIEQLATWWSGDSDCADGAAAALSGLGGDLEVLFVFIEGAFRNDVNKLRRALALAPDSLAVEMQLAAAVGSADPAARRPAYERVLSRLRAGDVAPTSPAAELVARVAKAPATLGGLLEELASAAYEQQDRVRAIALADELVKVDPDSMKGWQLRGHARLFELRYAEAAEAYADAIREITRIREEGERRGSIFFGDDPRPMSHFNRACAFGRLGMKEEALDALRFAVRGDEKYAVDATTEDWLECLWGMPEFEAITEMDPRALATKEELEAPFVARLIARCKGRFYAGERDAAIEAGERAVELASFRGDAVQESQALSALAYPLAFSGSAERAVELSAKAVALLEQAPIHDAASPQTPAQPVASRAEAVAIHAVVLHQHGDLDGAERAHLRAIELRREAYGEDAPVLAKSYGDLARLHAAQGKPSAEVRAMIERGIQTLARFLAGHEARDDDWAEAITDRGTLEANLAELLAGESLWSESVTALEAAAATFEAAQGTSQSPRVLEGAEALGERLAHASAGDAARARAVAARFEALRFPGSPAERRERAFFNRLRRVVDRMRAAGMTDELIATTLQGAARSANELPDALRGVPELASLAGEFATRAARYPTFLVMSAMSLQLAASDLDGALEDLEELCVGYALEAAAS